MSPHNCRQKGDSMYIWMDSMDSMDSILLYYLSDVFREFRLYRIFCIIRKASLGKLQEIDPNSLELSDRESFQQARSTQHCGGQKKMTSYSLLKRALWMGNILLIIIILKYFEISFFLAFGVHVSLTHLQ